MSNLIGLKAVVRQVWPTALRCSIAVFLAWFAGWLIGEGLVLEGLLPFSVSLLIILLEFKEEKRRAVREYLSAPSITSFWPNRRWPLWLSVGYDLVIVLVSLLCGGAILMVITMVIQYLF